MERKKWLLLVLLIFVVSAANAQLRFGLKGGFNIASVKFNKDVLNAENINGFHIGPMLEFMPDAGIGLDVAFLYSRKGFYSKDISREGSFTNDYLEVPVNFKCKIGLPLVSPYFAAGPYMSFRVAGDGKQNVANNIIDQIEAKSFGAGLNFTAGVEVLKRIQVGLTYDWGLTNNYQTFNAGSPSDYKGKEHTWLISAALMF